MNTHLKNKTLPNTVEVPVFSSVIPSLWISHEFPCIYTTNVSIPELDIMLQVISFIYVLSFCMNFSVTRFIHSTWCLWDIFRLIHIALVRICFGNSALYVVVLVMGRKWGRRRKPLKGPFLLWTVQTVNLVSPGGGDPIHSWVSCKCGHGIWLVEEANYNGRNWIHIDNLESSKCK